jgi:hypothetical protein
MTTKADFNAEEWSTIVEGPLMAGMRVVAAERGGTIRESIAIGKVYNEARQRAQGESELLDALVASPPGIDPQRLQQQGGGDVASVATERVREAVALLAEKAPDDADAYREFVLSVAQAAAEAHKEGGFVGIGGKPISDAEQAALDELRGVVQA